MLEHMTVATPRPASPAARRRRPSPVAAPSAHRAAWAPAAVAIAVALVSVAVFRGALAYFFAQDDFHGLARAAGLLPRLATPWRWLSGQLYFDGMRAIAGLSPLPYHLASLAAHAAVSALVVAWLSARVSAPAALLGAACFAAHPAIYQALYSISGIGEILALGLALAAWIAARRRDALRWAALPCFALSLLAKESTILLPAVLALERGLAGEREDSRAAPAWPVVIGLLAVAAAAAAGFAALDVFAVRRPLAASAPYHLSPAAMPANLLTYAGWTLNAAVLTVRGFSDAVDRTVFGWGGALFALLVAGACWRPLRRRGFLVGAAAWAAFLLPVLPLENHTYHYYLYAPLAGVAWCAAALFDGAREALAARGSAGRAAHTAHAAVPSTAAWAIAAALALLLVVNGAMLVRKIETYPFTDPSLRADPTVDRERIAANAVADLRAATIASGTRLLFVSPIAVELARAAGRDVRGETYFESNVRAALADGIAVRLFAPRVAAAEFLHEARPLGAGERYAL